MFLIRNYNSKKITLKHYNQCFATMIIQNNFLKIFLNKYYTITRINY